VADSTSGKCGEFLDKKAGIKILIGGKWQTQWLSRN
jgi:hypothetical protein